MSCCFLALALDDQTGNFEVGKDFDALRVNVAVPGGPIDMFEYNGPKVCEAPLKGYGYLSITFLK